MKTRFHPHTLFGLDTQIWMLLLAMVLALVRFPTYEADKTMFPQSK